jgi:hypothetical protein
MTSAQRGVRFCGWLLILWLRFLFSAAMAIGLARLGVPAYQDPGSAQWTAWAAPGAKSIGMMIVNLNNGDDEHYYASVDRAIRAASNTTEDRGYQKRRRSTVGFRMANLSCLFIRSNLGRQQVAPKLLLV